MNTLAHDPLAALLKRILLGTLVLITLIMAGVGIAHAGDDVASMGITTSVDDGS